MCNNQVTYSYYNTVKVEISDGNLIRRSGKNREIIIFEDFIFEDLFIYLRTCNSDINIRGI